PLPGPPPCVSPTTTSTTATTMSTTTTTPISPTTTTLPPQCLSDASCGDGNICNGVETCQAGVCIAGTPLDCDDGDPCTSDSCESRAGCQHTTVADLGSCSIVIPAARATCTPACRRPFRARTRNRPPRDSPRGSPAAAGGPGRSRRL